jgi:4-aminobutyrate aminotransferase-like enzyme
LATLEVIQKEKILDQVETKGKWIESLLQHKKIKELRRIGLMFAIDFDSEERVNRIVNSCKENGVICYWFLSHPYSFRIAPPLTITETEIRDACAVILNAIENS